MSKSAAKSAVNIASLGLVALLGYFLVRAVLGWMNPQSLWAAEEIAPPSAQTRAASAQSYDFSGNPFSKLDAAPAPIMSLGEDAPETTLKLKLMGMITGEDGAAILRTPDGQEARYGVGAEVMNNVTLEAVNATFVVLKVNGQIQRLTFEDDGEGLIKRAERDVVSSAPNMPAGAPSGATMNTLLSQVNIKPVRKDGKIIGQSITPKNSALNLSGFGLKNGDVVTKVGPLDLTAERLNFDDLRAVMQDARGLDVTVIRDGRSQIIQLGQ